ncbi:MAG: response regulator transcription factor [Cyanobacteria bacterium SZAS LIN-2]|nr:response regulator transcription factor [Cyanobacteria bacterium SZAS LIN-3]MBS1995199.1 response regulator transcription factor [Cyanobacteria bacterium SZAS LIN-2]MBS2006210.1 response regulator transcription factor [Cyanobacteria bacterium SZAS TMP-1]
MTVAKVLVIEDDVALAKMVSDWLSLEHHNTELVHDGADAAARLRVYDYDLIVLDWELPGVMGVDILKEFRSRGGLTPVLMLTGRGTIDDKEKGFDCGADDYLTKPFHAKELTARLRALLRRPEAYLGETLKVGDISLDRANFRVLRGDEEIRLLPKEFALLEFLMRNQNRVFAPEALLNRVWVTESEATVDALTTCIKRLRKKIDVEGKPSVIRTVHGVGYKLEA